MEQFIETRQEEGEKDEEKYQEEKKDTLEILEKHICPITKCIMENPVIFFDDDKNYEHEALVNWLSKYKTNPSNNNSLNKTGMHFNKPYKEVIEEFLKKNREHPKVKALNYFHTKQLLSAARQGDVTALKKASDTGVSLFATDMEGNTICHLGVQSKNPVKILNSIWKLASSAPDVTAKKHSALRLFRQINRKSQTVLHMAVQFVSKDIEELIVSLLRYGVHIDSKDKTEATALYNAVMKCSASSSWARALIKHGASIEIIKENIAYLTNKNTALTKENTTLKQQGLSYKDNATKLEQAKLELKQMIEKCQKITEENKTLQKVIQMLQIDLQNKNAEFKKPQSENEKASQDITNKSELQASSAKAIVDNNIFNKNESAQKRRIDTIFRQEANTANFDPIYQTLKNKNTLSYVKQALKDIEFLTRLVTPKRQYCFAIDVKPAVSIDGDRIIIKNTKPKHENFKYTIDLSKEYSLYKISWNGEESNHIKPISSLIINGNQLLQWDKKIYEVKISSPVYHKVSSKKLKKSKTSSKHYGQDYWHYTKGITGAEWVGTEKSDKSLIQTQKELCNLKQYIEELEGPSNSKTSKTKFF